MKFFCDNCQAQYMISDEKVGPAGVRVRCKKCQHVIYVKQLEADPSASERTVIAPAPDLRAAAPTPVPAPAPTPSGSGIFSSETPAEEQKFEAEIGQALDSVFAESSASAPPAESSAPVPGEQDSPFDRPAQEEPSTDARDAFPSATAESGHGVRAPAAGPTVVDWFIAVRDEQVGPLAAEEIKDRFERGEVGSDTLVWSAGLPDWRPLSTVQELAQMIVPRAAITRSEASTSNPRGEMPREVPVRKDSPAFRPSAASALASLASMAQEEIAAAAKSTPVPPTARAPGPAASALPSSESLLPEVPISAPPAAAAPVVNGQYHSQVQASDERPSYAAYAAPRHRISWVRVVSIGAAAMLVVGGAMATAFWFMVIKPEREQAARFAEQLATQLTAKSKELEAPKPPKAAAPSQPPAPAPEPATVAAAPVPTGNAHPGAPTPAPGPSASPSKPSAVDSGEHHGKGHKAAVPKTATAASDTPPATPKTAPAGSGSEDFLAGAGDSAIDKEFARELDGAGGSEGAKKSGAKHSPYIPPPPGQADLPQQLSQSDVIGVVAQHKDAFGRCVQEQKKRDPSSSGTVVMRWKIKPDGHTSDVGAAPGDYQDSPLAGCFKGQIVKMKFGQYRGAAMAPIQFPFNF
jgi:predicted Zn finger-like uncharacterized protein